jgi:ribosome-associated translation inhibitor RaiA
MQIQVHTDHSTDGREKVVEYVRALLEDAISHFSRHITRLDVHLSDENGAKGGADDKRCMMEARLENRHPLAVTQHAATMDEAIDGAAGKLKRALAHEIERLHEHRGHAQESK